MEWPPGMHRHDGLCQHLAWSTWDVHNCQAWTPSWSPNCLSGRRHVCLDSDALESVAIFLEGKELGPWWFRGFLTNQSSELNFPSFIQGKMARIQKKRGIWHWELHEFACRIFFGIISSWLTLKDVVEVVFWNWSDMHLFPHRFCQTTYIITTSRKKQGAFTQLYLQRI